MGFGKPPGSNFAERTMEWATGGLADVTEPSDAFKFLGWVSGTRPPAEFFNFTMRQNFFWFRWLDEWLFDGANNNELRFDTPALPALNQIFLSDDSLVGIGKAPTTTADPIGDARLQVSAKAGDAGRITVEGSIGASLDIKDTSADPGEKIWRIQTALGGFNIQRAADDESSLIPVISINPDDETIINKGLFVQDLASNNGFIQIQGTLSAQLELFHSTAPLNEKRFRLRNDTGILTIESLNDAGSAIQNTPLSYDQGTQVLSLSGNVLVTTSALNSKSITIQAAGTSDATLTFIQTEVPIRSYSIINEESTENFVIRDDTAGFDRLILDNTGKWTIFGDLLSNAASDIGTNAAPFGSMFAADAQFLTVAAEPTTNDEMTTRHRKNSIVAWARVSSTGSIFESWGIVDPVVNPVTGRYNVTLINGGTMGGLSHCIIATAEQVLTGVARIAHVDPTTITTTTFDIIIKTSTGAPVNSNFSVLVVGEPAP